MRGAEADIVDVRGTLFGHGIPMPNKIPGDPYPEPLDLETRILSDTDYAIASVHIKTFCSLATPAQNAAMYVHALEHPRFSSWDTLVGWALTLSLTPSSRPLATGQTD